MTAYDPQNPFAKILRGEFPCFKVYEDEHVLAFLDIMPRVPGHTLVIPKAPARNILDIKTEDYLHVARATHKIAAAAKKAFNADGITIHWLTGSDITEDAWDAFFAFYMETGSRKWGRPYLNRAFYSLIGESMANDVLLVMARRNHRWIAGAINFIGSDTLFGRHWGATEHHPFLHFEVCYYQAIDFAIQRKLAVVEAGAQGEHKLARGYLPHTTYSAHYIADPDLRRAIADYLKRERAYVAEAGRELTELGPFRKVQDEAP